MAETTQQGTEQRAPEFSIRRMAGPCANGWERNGGTRWHALPGVSSRALCGARTNSFWSDEVGAAVTCPRCLARLAKTEGK